VDKYLGELLTKQKQQKGAIQGFRDALSELPSLLSEPRDKKKDESDAPKPLIFIIHLTFHLVDRERYRHERTVTKFMNYLERSMDFKPQDGDIVARTTELVSHVAERRNLSLRAIERITTNLALSLAYTPDNVLRPPPILAGLCILKVVAPELFEKAKRGRLKYVEVRPRLTIQSAVLKFQPVLAKGLAA
jgi:hypothetical protein